MITISKIRKWSHKKSQKLTRPQLVASLVALTRENTELKLKFVKWAHKFDDFKRGEK